MILRIGTVASLHRWLTRAHATNIHALQRFVRTLRQDLSAVEGAMTERWSNGPVEGQVNRLKTLRRQMYGRAGVELLRARLLPHRDRRAVAQHELGGGFRVSSSPLHVRGQGPRSPISGLESARRSTCFNRSQRWRGTRCRQYHRLVEPRAVAAVP